jgi:Fe-S cluster biosynthesis and repair protein YggX
MDGLQRSAIAMSQLAERIAQFRKMATDDPDNELGHFRLGQLLMEDKQLEEAIASFRRTVELSPQFSKAYQLLGNCLMQLDRKPDAVQVLQKGYQVADERGDNVPREEMAKMLQALGAEAPAARPAAAPAAPGGFRCQRPGCMAGGHAHQLPSPPMSDEIGQRIYQQICAACWEAWLRGYSIKVINELWLDLGREDHQAMYDQYMKEFFGFE